MHSTLDNDHQLEKLEFALAVSQAVGDKIRSTEIKNKIEEIGIKLEEPGT